MDWEDISLDLEVGGSWVRWEGCRDFGLAGEVNLLVGEDVGVGLKGWVFSWVGCRVGLEGCQFGLG